MAITTPQGIDLQAGEPLDLKIVKQNESERLSISEVTRYDGLAVYEVDTHRTYQLQGGVEDTFWVLIGSGAGGDTSYTNLTPVPVTQGGITAGSTFDNIALQEMWDKFLYPYQAPLASLSTVPIHGLYEKGFIIDQVILTAISTKRDNDIIEMELFRGVSLLEHVSPVNPEGQTVVYTELNDVISNTTFKVTVRDVHSMVTSSRTFSFANPYFYGVGSKSLSVTQVQELTKQVVTKSNKTYAFSPTNQVYYFAYPQSYGLLSSIKDTNNFETLDDWTVRSEIFNTNGSYFLDNNVSYYVYEFKNLTTQVNFNNTFKY